MLSRGLTRTEFAAITGWALWAVRRSAGKLNRNLCKVLIRTQTIPIRELQSHLHSSIRLPMASTARLVCLGSIFWNPAPERLSHMTGLFASLCCWIPREVCSKRKGLNKWTEAKTKDCSASACPLSPGARGGQSGRRVAGSTVQNFRLIKHTHKNCNISTKWALLQHKNKLRQLKSCITARLEAWCSRLVVCKASPAPLSPPRVLQNRWFAPG